MATIQTAVEIDWMACELIEAVPGKVSGKPVVVGTRIMPEAIAGNYELGDSIEEIYEGISDAFHCPDQTAHRICPGTAPEEPYVIGLTATRNP